ncbi:alpha/beta-hydrolase [Hypoxylon fragiforme]|uniref:alpha/beta-hydrolase n=1 Tax=Hypoxylon fragiforme TaxID=63214 RepID=UPI0020C5E67E|nr:alpha/beta-hydrolase [Hypoxylon fragiforme]KAI2613835.1 alpha/beta-hydrolase [Hypoxylon fragiforme]
MLGTICLPHKPNAPLSYRFVPGQGPLSTTHLVVFLNGLLLPHTSWQATIEDLQRRWAESGAEQPLHHDHGHDHRGHKDDGHRHNHPSLLAYDRYGQGDSVRDPADEGGSHDIREVVRDLRVLTQEIWKLHSHVSGSSSNNGEGRTEAEETNPNPPNLIFIANSIGCPLARLFATTYPASVSALLLLDSNIANSDLVSLFPDPDAPAFDPATAHLPPDVTVADLRRARAAYAALFHPSVPNAERWDRRNLASLLPRADSPALGEAWLTVVGHDWATFALDGERGSLGVPRSLTDAYVNPAWARYNEGLVRLARGGRARGPVIAVGCGHFIQRDDPRLVAELADELIRRVREEGEAVVVVGGLEVGG